MAAGDRWADDWGAAASARLWPRGRRPEGGLLAMELDEGRLSLWAGDRWLGAALARAGGGLSSELAPCLSSLEATRGMGGS